jgi:superfamily II DNA helicase RecQ
MNCKQALITYPRQANESKNKWFKRVAELTGLHHKSINKHYYKYRQFVETQRKYDKNGNVISRVEKLQQANLVDVPDGLELSRVSTNVTTGQQWLIHTKESQNKALFKLNKDLIKQTLKEANLKPLEVLKISPTSNKVLKVTYTDVHVGLNITENLYGLRKWNEFQLMDALQKIVYYVGEQFNGQSKIIVADYGDFMDGWDAKTTRGGHILDQNMSNEEAFKVGAQFKIELAKDWQNLECLWSFTM